jgi:hypothetical protein
VALIDWNYGDTSGSTFTNHIDLCGGLAAWIAAAFARHDVMPQAKNETT